MYESLSRLRAFRPNPITTTALHWGSALRTRKYPPSGDDCAVFVQTKVGESNPTTIVQGVKFSQHNQWMKPAPRLGLLGEAGTVNNKQNGQQDQEERPWTRAHHSIAIRPEHPMRAMFIRQLSQYPHSQAEIEKRPKCI